MKSKLLLILIILSIILAGCGASPKEEMTDEEIMDTAEDLFEDEGKMIIDEDDYLNLLVKLQEFENNSSQSSENETDNNEDTQSPETVQTDTTVPDTQPSDTSTDELLGTRLNPASIGDEIIIDTYTSKISITLTEIIRGDEAMTIALAANRYNDVNEGKELIMAKFNIINIENLSSTDEAYYISTIRFDYSNSNYAVETGWASVAGLENELRADLYEGASTEGYMCFEADIDELKPHAIFEEVAWFDISGN